LAAAATVMSCIKDLRGLLHIVTHAEPNIVAN